MKITKQSTMTGKTHTMDIPVTLEELGAWMNNPNPPLIQRAFPHLSPEHREFLLTGVTPEEWNEAFPEDEEEEW
jgi:hypothetical protein